MTTLDQKAVGFFEGLSATSLDLVDEFYASEVHFEDPMVCLHGRERMRAYYAKIYRNEPELLWEFPDVVRQNEKVALFWVMHMRVDGLNRGRPIRVDGMSRLVFDAEDRCVYHRDYFDMGAFVYENVPVLRGVIGWVKKKLHGPDFSPSADQDAER